MKVRSDGPPPGEGGGKRQRPQRDSARGSGAPNRSKPGHSNGRAHTAPRTPPNGNGTDANKNVEPEVDDRPVLPWVPDDVHPRDLDRAARGQLRTLSSHDADWVARHLVMAGRLLDEDPEAAYGHARAAFLWAGRVGVVREAAGLAAYYTGRYAEALRELRTVRRLSGSVEHLPVMADCERGLGRPERALELARDPAARTLDPAGQIELALVVAGARLDLGEPTGALVALDSVVAHATDAEQTSRISEVRADALHAAGRHAEAEELRATLLDDEVMVVDLEDADEEALASDGPADGPPAVHRNTPQGQNTGAESLEES